jgi:uncharacterized membrane protein
MLTRQIKLKIKRLKLFDNIFILNKLVVDIIKNSSMKRLVTLVLAIVVIAAIFSSCSKKTCPAYSEVKTSTSVSKA